ncbi:MAG: ribose-5-phosphate isomerase RpiA [Planctomycetes bacterium]|nr:ribose-5-phosphate isomerase RpiA [Planctomycetota bacterium]
MTDPAQAGKRAAGRAAAELVRSGQLIGLGTGSTVRFLLERLAERIQDEGLSFVGFPTSEDTRRRATALGIPLGDLESVDRLDLAIDGADEIDGRKDMIKGGGGALLRERIVAAAAREMVVIVSHDKIVPVLGNAFALPVEVLPFGLRQAAARVRELGAQVVLRKDKEGHPFVTDQGNRILDCHFGGIPDPGGLGESLHRIPSVIDHGLFVGMAGRVYVGDGQGRVRTW